MHNFGLVTSWEVLDGNGKVVRKSGKTAPDGVKEGKIRTRIYDAKGRLEYSSEQPMRSFVCGMIKDFVNGYRVALSNSGYQANAPRVMLGAKSAPVYVQQPFLIHPYISYPTNALVSGSVSSEVVPVSLISITDQAGSTRVTLHTARKITAGYGSLGEIALYSDGNNMIARDVISPEGGFGVGKTVETAWSINLPATASKAITKNWIKNWVQNINNTAYTDFKDLLGNSVTGAMAVTVATFTKEVNTRGGLGITDIGLIVGSSDATVTADDYQLGSQIPHGSSSNTVEYAAMPATSSIPVIHPLRGKAEVTYCRDFTNNSGAPIVIKEAGLVAKTASTSEGVTSGGSFLLARWLTGTVTLNQGEILRIYFKPTITATAEILEGLTTDIVVVTDAMREIYPELAEISMVQKIGVSNKTWPQALEYAWNLNLGGYTDWRLPRCAGNQTDGTVNNELYGLYRARGSLGLASDSNYYWSASEKDASNAWVVNFSNGLVYDNYKDNTRYVRCVR